MTDFINHKHLIHYRISEYRVRVFFWILALGFAGANAYTSRYFINDDAIVYIEIGEAIKQFRWHDVANFTFSPLYASLIAMFQSIFRLNALNEIMWLKLLNYIIFVSALGALEVLLRFLKNEYRTMVDCGGSPLPWPFIQALLYSTFLATALISVRVRLINPDMLVFCLLLLCFSVLMWIRENSNRFYKFVILGCLTGLGYLSKAFVFLFSPVLLIMAAIAVGSLKKCLPRIALAALFLILTIGPLVAALSLKKGSFTYGEGGRHVYSILIGGNGKPVNQGKVLDVENKVVVYEYGDVCTRPFSFDVCYWTIGINPSYDNVAHLKLFLTNLLEIVSQSRWLSAIIAWAIFQIYLGSYQVGSLKPISLTILFIVPAICGIFLFALISMEPRYIAPFLFLGSVGLIMGIGWGKNQKVFLKLGISDLGVLALVLFMIVSILQSSVDQAIRGLWFENGKISYRQSFEDQISVSNFLATKGVTCGDHVAVLGNSSIQWARMAKVRVTGEIEDPEKFFKITKAQRTKSLTLLKNEGIKAVITQRKECSRLTDEGWVLIPQTETFYARLL